MIGVFKLCSIGFRPLDGESFSKLGCIVMPEPGEPSFRPLDGESFSKHRNGKRFIWVRDLVSVP